MVVDLRGERVDYRYADAGAPIPFSSELQGTRQFAPGQRRGTRCGNPEKEIEYG